MDEQKRWRRCDGGSDEKHAENSNRKSSREEENQKEEGNGEKKHERHSLNISRRFLLDGLLGDWGGRVTIMLEAFLGWSQP